MEPRQIISPDFVYEGGLIGDTELHVNIVEKVNLRLELAKFEVGVFARVPKLLDNFSRLACRILSVSVKFGKSQAFDYGYC